jgi:hypothetical protein
MLFGGFHVLLGGDMFVSTTSGGRWFAMENQHQLKQLKQIWIDGRGNDVAVVASEVCINTYSFCFNKKNQTHAGGFQYHSDITGGVTPWTACKTGRWLGHRSG